MKVRFKTSYNRKLSIKIRTKKWVALTNIFKKIGGVGSGSSKGLLLCCKTITLFVVFCFVVKCYIPFLFFSFLGTCSSKSKEDTLASCIHMIHTCLSYTYDIHLPLIYMIQIHKACHIVALVSCHVMSSMPSMS